MPETIFSKIIRGEIPAARVYEDDHVLAFLDIGPLSEGHTLVIPKEAVATLDQLSDEAAAAIGRVLPRLCRAIVRATGCAAYNVLQNNGTLAHQVVHHVHFHIIPKPAPGSGPGSRPSPGAGLEMDWQPGTLDTASAGALASRIVAELGPELGPELGH